MKNIEDGKDIYDNIEIPKELEEVVKNTIKKYPKDSIENKKIKKFPVFKMAGYAAAAVVVCFTVALNTSESFAREAGDMPLLGGIAKVLTVRSYETHEDNKNITVNIPAVDVAETAEGEEENIFATLQNKEFTGDINAEIEKLIDDYVTDAEKRFEEYKEAFLANGGTEEEWAGREIDIRSDYEVKFQQGNVLSLVLSVDESWAAAYGERYYYNLDLESNKKLTLKDVLGDSYQETADAVIINEMQARMKADENYVYWGYTEDDIEIEEGFKGVNEETQFYINEAGNPVVCFGKYEIAPGFMGIQEFEIK